MILGVIHWEINGKTGHGSAIDPVVAVATAKIMNEKYGEGTHWVVFCGES
jgi:hypothetical protein